MHFHIKEHNSNRNSHFFNFFHSKAYGTKFDLAIKIGQGQPRVIIYINYIELTFQMLHTKFQGHRLSGSGEEDFFNVFTIYGRRGHLGHVTWTKYINFLSPLSIGCI